MLWGLPVIPLLAGLGLFLAAPERRGTLTGAAVAAMAVTLLLAITAVAGDWQATLVTAYERGVRLHLELPPGGVLTGLARRVFELGQAVAFAGARLDTLDAMLRQEVSLDR